MSLLNFRGICFVALIGHESNVDVQNMAEMKCSAPFEITVTSNFPALIEPLRAEYLRKYFNGRVAVNSNIIAHTHKIPLNTTDTSLSGVTSYRKLPGDWVWDEKSHVLTPSKDCLIEKTCTFSYGKSFLVLKDRKNPKTPAEAFMVVYLLDAEVESGKERKNMPVVVAYQIMQVPGGIEFSYPKGVDKSGPISQEELLKCFHMSNFDVTTYFSTTPSSQAEEIRGTSKQEFEH